jgi:PTS system galactitol-specific IIA component
MTDLLISPDLIEISLEVKSKEDGISILSQKLTDNGLVAEGFCQHILDREEKYPTGLPTSIPVALCHTEADYVNRSALALATLKNPVLFHEMGTPENELAVEVIFVLALKDPKDQVPMLRKIVSLFQNRETLRNIRYAVSGDVLSDYLKQSLKTNETF